MGTRSTTKIYETYIDKDKREHKELLLALYKQYDGHPESWGKELKDFIKSGQFVNGINSEKQCNKKLMFNGVGCFALQLVRKFKEDSGELYATTKDDEQEYNYIINYISPVELDDNQKVSNKLLGNFPSNGALIKISCKERPSFNEEIMIEVR